MAVTKIALGFGICKKHIQNIVEHLRLIVNKLKKAQSPCMGLIFDGGVQVPNSFGIIFLEDRYTYELKNQQKSGTVTYSSNVFQFDLTSDKEEDKYTNKGFQLFAGITIPFGKN